jgi:hypothetical protein
VPSYQTFTTTAGQTGPFALNQPASAVFSVSLDGPTLVPGVDYTLGTSTLSLSNASPGGQTILVEFVGYSPFGLTIGAGSAGYAGLQSRIAAELRRSDLSTQIVQEIASSIEYYQYEEFPWTEASMVPFQTIQGQRYYTLPANFMRVTDVLSQIGNYTYYLQPETEQYLDRIDWGNTFWTSYPLLFSIWSNQIRLFPPPQVGLPVQVKGIIQQLQLLIPTKTWTASTGYSQGDTIADAFGNVQQCTTPGTTGAIAPSWPTPAFPNTTIATAMLPPVAGQMTIDNTVTWTLVGTTSNVWTTQAEELIRTRSLKNLHARYTRNQGQAGVMESFEKDLFSNMQYKNAQRTALGRVRGHL